MKLFSRRFDDIYFLVGLDAFSDIGLWKGSDELFKYTNFVVMARPGKRMEGFSENLKREIGQVDGSTWNMLPGKRIHLLHITQLDVSSTRIRELSMRGNRYGISFPAG